MMMSRPLVSVVIPYRNVDATIGETLNSLVMQSMPDFEVLLIDDGSTDKTREVIRNYFDPRFKVINLGEQRGIAAALNVGLNAASGKYIARMDGDDICYLNRFRDQVAFLDANSLVDLIGTGADVFGAMYAIFRSPLSHQLIVDQFLVNNPFIHPTVFFRRELIDSGIYHYNEDFQTDEDYELWSRLLPRIRAENLDHSSIRYRRHANSNQNHPHIFQSKIHAIRQFCHAFAIADKLDPQVLAELQCSGFVTNEGFEQLRRYARYAEEFGKPKLGWLQDVFLREGSYSQVMNYYDAILGYRPFWGTF